jgi:hypothetical protein
MSGETCVHSARAYSKAMHTIPTLFVPNHEKPQPLYFEGNMQSQIVLIQCIVLHVTKLACTHIPAPTDDAHLFETLESGRRLQLLAKRW